MAGGIMLAGLSDGPGSLHSQGTVNNLLGVVADHCKGKFNCLMRRLGQVLVFCKIRAALGIMSTIISGGGSLAPHLDDFFEA